MNIRVESTAVEQETGTVSPVTLEVTGGRIVCRLHRAEGDTAVLYVFGAGGGLGGPAGGMYERMAGRLQPLGVTSLQLDYRRPGRLDDCIEDVLAGLEYLGGLGKSRIALVGHSFGGAVVIGAGIESGSVIAVAALSSQTMGAEDVRSLSPKPLLLIHGKADEVLPYACSLQLYGDAREPKELLLYDGCRHGLDECREQLDDAMTSWLREVLELGPVSGG